MIKSCALALTLALALPLASLAQEKTAPAQPTEAEMMAAMMKLAQPNENHKLMSPMAGTFDVVNKMWMGPGEPTVTKGKATNTWKLGGRFLHSDYEGTFMGQPFMGMGLTGYDNASGKYQSTWSDNISTTIMLMTGSYDAAKKTFTFSGEAPGPAGMQPLKETIRIVDDNTHVFEMWDATPGKEMKVMEITYTRVK